MFKPSLTKSPITDNRFIDGKHVIVIQFGHLFRELCITPLYN